MTNHTTDHPPVRLFHAESFGEKIDALRYVFANPGVHTLKDTSTQLDRIESEARDVVRIHGRTATITRVSPLTLRIEVTR